MVRRWFNQNDQFKRAANLLYAPNVLESAPVNIRFLAAVWAIEAYSRSRGEATYMDPGQYDQLVAKLIESIPPELQPDHRQSLANRLRYGNEYSLRKRISELVSRLPQELQCRLTGGNEKKFVTGIVDTRNYYTHHDHSLQEKAIAPAAAHYATERLQILLIANILLDLGIGESKLVEAMNKYTKYHHRLFTPLEW